MKLCISCGLSISWAIIDCIPSEEKRLPIPPAGGSVAAEPVVVPVPVRAPDQGLGSGSTFTCPCWGLLGGSVKTKSSITQVKVMRKGCKSQLLDGFSGKSFCHSNLVCTILLAPIFQSEEHKKYWSEDIGHCITEDLLPSVIEDGSAEVQLMKIRVHKV